MESLPECSTFQLAIFLEVVEAWFNDLTLSCKRLGEHSIHRYRRVCFDSVDMQNQPESFHVIYMLNCGSLIGR